MRYSFAAIGMIMIGLFAFAVVMVFQNVTINNESDYYTLKEAMEASMYESIDWVYYGTGGFDENGDPIIDNEFTGCYGPVKIIEEKFVANFTRRFLKNTMGNSNGCTIEFYDIMEFPPKAAVVVRSKASSMSLSSNDFSVVNNLSGILESRPTGEYSQCEINMN